MKNTKSHGQNNETLKYTLTRKDIDVETKKNADLTSNPAVLIHERKHLADESPAIPDDQQTSRKCTIVLKEEDITNKQENIRTRKTAKSRSRNNFSPRN